MDQNKKVKFTNMIGHFFASFATILISVQGGAGGSLVGNGAGIVEHNIIYVYNALPKTIDACLNLPTACMMLNEGDRAVLQSVRNLIIQNPSSTERILFKSEKESPGFFETGLGQAHRLAKTGNSPADPIYWNLDLLYTSDGSPALDLPTISAIWVHEIGHQLQIENHQYLDQIASFVRIFLKDNIQQIKYYPIPLSVTSVEYPTMTSSTDLYFSDGLTSVSLNRFFSASSLCPAKDQMYLSSHLWNIHWGAAVISADQMKIEVSGFRSNRCLMNKEIQEYHNIPFTLVVTLKKIDGVFHYESANNK
jgi:hypothetical protein